MQITEEKTKLRDELFNLYFKNENGIKVSDLIEKSKFIKKSWKELKEMLRNNIADMDLFSNINYIKRTNDKKYIIVKSGIDLYYIIDLNTKGIYILEDYDNKYDLKNISSKTILSLKDKCLDETSYFGDIKELNDYYEENEEIFSLPTTIRYKLNIGDATTFFIIHLNNFKSYFGFETPDQYLYETLWFDENFDPLGIQDAHKIGIERMNEMFSEIKKVIIPYEVIPKEILNIINNQKKLSLNNNINNI